MIARIAGRVVEKNANSVIVDVSGVGYEVLLAASDMERFLIDEEAVIYTYHHIREQAQDLFGFSTQAAKKLFELLITVQGIGPRAAMSILSIDDVESVRNAIANGDHKFISRAGGVGKKSAERVIVDLHDKVGFATASATGANWGQSSALTHGDDALDALVALGFNLADAEAALSTVSAEFSVSERVTAALKSLR